MLNLKPHHLFSVLCLMFGAFSCTEASLTSSDFMPDSPDQRLQIRGGTIIVSPSGDASGTTDADNIEQALNTTGASKVILEAGTFYIKRTLTAPEGYDGVLRGQGKDVTRIQGVGSAGTPFQTGLIHVPLESGPVTGSSFFYFPEPSNDLTIADLSMLLPNNFVAATSTTSDNINHNNLSSFIAITLGDPVPDVELRNLRLQGTEAAPGSPGWFLNQPIIGAAILGDRDGFPQPAVAGGKIKVQRCHIAGTAYQALVVESIKEGKVSINSNQFADTKQVNIRFLDGCDIRVSNNSFNTTDWGSIVVTQEQPLGYGPIYGSNSSVRITNNDISSNGFLGVEIGPVPFSDAPIFEVEITDNTIIMGPGAFGTRAGIAVFTGHNGADIQDNIIMGEADYAVYLSSVSNCEISNTATSGFTPLIADYGLTGNSNNNVVDTTHPATAVDEGFGNSFIGPIIVQ